MDKRFDLKFALCCLHSFRSLKPPRGAREAFAERRLEDCGPFSKEEAPHAESADRGTSINTGSEPVLTTLEPRDLQRLLGGEKT